MLYLADLILVCFERGMQLWKLLFRSVSSMVRMFSLFIDANHRYVSWEKCHFVPTKTVAMDQWSANRPSYIVKGFEMNVFWNVKVQFAELFGYAIILLITKISIKKIFGAKFPHKNVILLRLKNCTPCLFQKFFNYLFFNRNMQKKMKYF